jgi:signal recognition particle GTPase
VTKGVNASQQLTKVVADELCTLMGGFGGAPSTLNPKPDAINPKLSTLNPQP